MNIRFANEDVRIRLSKSDWDELVDQGRFSQTLFLGWPSGFTAELAFGNQTCVEAQATRISISLVKDSVRAPLKKKDPYWSYTNEQGVRYSLDVDIFAEEKC